MLGTTSQQAALVAIGMTQAFRVDLYTLTLLDGTVIRWHDGGDSFPNPPIAGRTDSLSVGGNVFLKGPGMGRSTLTVETGVKVSQLSWTLYPKPAADADGPADTIKGYIVPEACRRRLLDKATVQLDTLIMPTWGDTATIGAITRFLGRVGEIQATYGKVTITVNNDVVLLTNLQMPRNLWQPSCNHTLYDSGCALIKANFATSHTVGGVPTLTAIATSSPGAYAGGYFDLGTIEFTSGAAAGQKRTIQSFDGTTFSLFMPLDAMPSAGDAFTAYPGCDLSQGAGGCAKFNNLAHFRGFPYVPDPQTAL